MRVTNLRQHLRTYRPSFRACKFMRHKKCREPTRHRRRCLTHHPSTLNGFLPRIIVELTDHSVIGLTERQCMRMHQRRDHRHPPSHPLDVEWCRLLLHHDQYSLTNNNRCVVTVVADLTVAETVLHALWHVTTVVNWATSAQFAGLNACTRGVAPPDDSASGQLVEM